VVETFSDYRGGPVSAPIWELHPQTPPGLSRHTGGSNLYDIAGFEWE